MVNESENSMPLDILKTALSSSPELREGERRTVTVLFSDMKGFTSLSEASDPEELDLLMSRVFAYFEAIIKKHGGYVEKYIGDAMVAVFGIPELHEDDSARALASAFEFNMLLQRPPATIPTGLLFRTGIHSGLVTTGRRGEFDVVTGHTLAVASRLQDAAQPGRIMVSRTVRDQCNKLFVFGEREELSLKGKNELIRAYYAIGRRKRIFDYTNRFINRKGPLDFLNTEYLRHMRGEFGGVFITGEAGIGKTRMVAEFWKNLKGFPGFNATFLAVNPSSYGKTPYASLLHLAADFLDLSADAGFEEFSMAAGEKARLSEEYHRDAYLLWKGHDDENPKVFFDAVLALFDAILASDDNIYPDLVFIDNASAVDEKSLEFFRSYMISSAQKPFIILCDRQKNESIALVFGMMPELQLDSLSDDDSRTLAESLYSPEVFQDDVLKTIVERSQGYPLFIEEYVQFVKQNRHASGLPDNIQNTILASLEKIQPGARALVGRLSVLPYPFSVNFANAMQNTVESMDETCKKLEVLAAEKILVKGQDDLWYFKHSVVREAIYSSVLIHNRKLLHGMAADFLVGKSWPVELFYHIVAAEEWKRAKVYLLEARPALPVENVPSIQKVIDNCPDATVGEIIELHFLKYATLYNNHEYNELFDIVHDMYRIALRTRERFYLARSYHLLMTSYLMILDFRSAVIWGKKALDAYEGAENREGAANARFYLVGSYMALNETGNAAHLMEGFDKESEYSKRLYEEQMVNICRSKGMYRESRQWSAKILERLAAEGNDEGVKRKNEWLLADTLEDFFFSSAPDITPRHSYYRYDIKLAVSYHAALALVKKFAGDDEASLQAFKAADYYLAQARRDIDAAIGGANLAWARLLAGHLDEAGKIAIKALEAAIQCRHYQAMFSCQVSLAELAFISGDKAEFVFFVRDAANLAAAPVQRERKTLARFWYFAWVYADSAPENARLGELLRKSEADEYLARAKEMIENDLEELDEADRALAVDLSVFARILMA